MRNLGAIGWLALALVSGGLMAAEPSQHRMQLTAGLAAPQPELLQPGQCVRYQEGGAGFMGREPLFWLEGEVRSSRHEPQQLKHCPADWQDKTPPMTRADFLQREQFVPCVAPRASLPGNTEMAWVKLRVQRWETPWDKSWGNKGRLYRGMYLDQELSTNLDLEINARLLTSCPAD